MVDFKKGFTTGTCAQAAAKGACLMFINQSVIDRVDIETASGVVLTIELADQKITRHFASCSVIKDAGDDIDITNGAKICVKVRNCRKKDIIIKGGDGVGRVTKPGLAVGVGEYAINPTPRKMILKEVTPFLQKRKGGLEVTISVPGGEKLAKQTYNPRLGIKGGISIIGTTGIVEPKSLDAYKASLCLELDVFAAQGHKQVVFVLGYVGERFCKDMLRLNEDAIIKIGDHIGFMLKECAKRNIKNILLVGHIGKLVKVAHGQFNTHFSFGDKRIDSIAQYAAGCGAGKKIISQILQQESAEATIGLLKDNGLTCVFDEIADDVSKRLEDFTDNKTRVGCIILSLKQEVLARKINEYAVT